MQFKEWFETSVYRIDKDKIDDFSSGLRTYHHTPDWKTSGTFEKESDAPPDWGKSTGLFAGQLRNIIPYATPRDTRWIVTWDNPRPTVTFDQKDKVKIMGYRPYLSKFPASGFNQVPSGEFFSKTPPTANKQEVIRNPIKFIQKWYNVNFVPDIQEFANQLKSQNIQFDAEGM